MSENYGPMSYYWEGKMDGISGYDINEDSSFDPEYVAGFEVGNQIRLGLTA